MSHFPSEDYEGDLQRGLSLSGESAEYFAAARVAHTLSECRRVGLNPGRVLEFGCGTGLNLPLLKQAFPKARVAGTDVDPRLLEQARRRAPGVDLIPFGSWEAEEWDLIYINGVFHHIPPLEWRDWLKRLCASNADAGCMALFENNPWNPGTHWVMSRIPFDRDATMAWPHSLRNMLHVAGYGEVRSRFLFIFPRFLGLLRPLEPCFARLPLGAQYCLFGRPRR